MKKIGLLIVVVLCSGFVLGCSQSTAKKDIAESYDGTKFLLATEPVDRQEVIEARTSVKDADDVVILGRIGGGLNPWVEGVAAFQIVDSSLLACSDDKEDGEPCSCKTPWDYCCETDKLPNAMALVQFVEPDGSVVKQGARELFDLEELQTVIVRGKAKRDDSGNLTVLADGLFVVK